MTTINLSYLITTRNKLPYLRHALERLLPHSADDEEIIVVDGGSTDGTVDFLAELHQQGRIHHFVSEPDYGEAHGFNKGLLLARSELIKLLTDDDVFDYAAIRECKRFMLGHPCVDVLIGNIANTSLESPEAIEIIESSQAAFEEWRRDGGPVAFTGLSLMMRRSSLPFTGLFATNTAYPDTEYTLRITSLPVTIAWCTAMIAVRIDNAHSNFRNLEMQRRIDESDRMYYYYSDTYRRKARNVSVAVFRPLWRLLRSAHSRLVVEGRRIGALRTSSTAGALNTRIPMDSVFATSESWLSNHNKMYGCAFLLPSKATAAPVNYPSTERKKTDGAAKGPIYP